MSGPAEAGSQEDTRPLEAVLRLHGPASRSRTSLDRNARVAAQLLEAPIALVSLIDADREIIYGSHGPVKPSATFPIISPLGSPCRLVLESGAPLALGGHGKRALADYQEILGEEVVAYLGVPLTTGGGQIAGTLSVLDTRPRQWSEQGIELLMTVSHAVQNELEMRQELDELKLVEQGRVDTDARVIRIMEDVTDGFFALDSQWRFTYLNPAVQQLIGRPRREIVGTEIWSCFPEIVGTHLQEEYERVVRDGVPAVFEAYHEPTDVWVLIHAYPSEGGLSVYAHDITGRKRAELRVGAAEEHYRRLVTTMPQSVYVVDREGVFTEVNVALERMLGRDAEDLLGTHFATVIADESLPYVEGLFADLMSGRLPTVEFETWVTTTEGERLLLAISATGIRQGDLVTGVHGVARDVTEQREREALRLILADALDGLGDGVCLLSVSGEIVYCNRTYREIFGISPDGPLPHRVFDLALDEDSRQSQRERLHTAATEGRWSGRIWRRPGGALPDIPLDIVIARVVAADGTVMLFGIAREASDQVEHEQQLRWMERLASIGTLVGGVAHELNNPLNAVLNFAQLLAMDEPDPERREDLVTIQREAERMAKIVADLKQIARTAREERSELSAVDLNEVITHVLKVQDYRLRTSNIDVRLDLEPELPPVMANRSQMEQVLLNLVINAEQAMATEYGEGNLLVRTRQTARGVSLYVLDDGPGIAPSLLQRIFDPFFTTKTTGDGTGLGLSLVHSIITQHGGEVRVESEVAAGTAFRIDLPAAPRTVSPPAPPAPSGANRSLRILVVDDEAAIRRVISRHLSRRGHQVDEAAEGGAALEKIAAAGSYDVVLSDLRMPGMGGEAFLMRLRERDRKSRVVLMTGDASGAGMHAEQQGVQVLLKPVKLEELTRVIETEGSRG